VASLSEQIYTATSCGEVIRSDARASENVSTQPVAPAQGEPGFLGKLADNAALGWAGAKDLGNMAIGEESHHAAAEFAAQEAERKGLTASQQAAAQAAAAEKDVASVAGPVGVLASAAGAIVKPLKEAPKALGLLLKVLPWAVGGAVVLGGVVVAWKVTR
jgi:hypothetical protein